MVHFTDTINVIFMQWLDKTIGKKFTDMLSEELILESETNHTFNPKPLTTLIYSEVLPELLEIKHLKKWLKQRLAKKRIPEIISETNKYDLLPVTEEELILNAPIEFLSFLRDKKLGLA